MRVCLVELVDVAGQAEVGELDPAVAEEGEGGKCGWGGGGSGAERGGKERGGGIE